MVDLFVLCISASQAKSTVKHIVIPCMYWILYIFFINYPSNAIDCEHMLMTSQNMINSHCFGTATGVFCHDN